MRRIKAVKRVDKVEKSVIQLIIQVTQLPAEMD